MTIKCIKTYENDAGKEYITVGREYVVLEIICTKNKRQDGYRIDYRIIDDDGIPGMYKVEYFEITNNDLTHMVMCEKAYGYVITHGRIADSSLEKENVNGFWAEYFEIENVKAKQIVEEIFCELNKNREASVDDCIS